VTLFQDHKAIGATDAWTLLKRLFQEQCEVTPEPQSPAADDDDHSEGGVAAMLKKPKEVGSDSLQTPHDPDATYSAHKGKGYAVQIAETCVEANPVQLITEVEVTPACVSDAKATVPMLHALEAAGVAPEEIIADTTYSGAKNAAALADHGVNLTAPAPVMGKPKPGRRYRAPEEYCPNHEKGAAQWLKRQEASPDFAERYAPRAGIEATNSELKRPHGLGKLRVRGGLRVRLAVYFKALACNLKRALRCWVASMTPDEGVAAHA